MSTLCTNCAQVSGSGALQGRADSGRRKVVSDSQPGSAGVCGEQESEAVTARTHLLGAKHAFPSNKNCTPYSQNMMLSGLIYLPVWFFSPFDYKGHLHSL